MADLSVDPECKDPKELFGQGVRAYVLQDYEVAVAVLSKASELLVIEHNDDMHESLGEIYLFYGKALLGLSREQNEALGDAVPKNSTDDSEDEEEEQDEGIENEESEENKTEENSATSSINGDASKTELGAKNEKISRAGSSKPESSEATASGTNKATDKEASEEPTDEDDTSDLQLAWEVLELAKKIFQRQDDKKNLAETLIVLGEVSLESENFESAINDIKQGLEVQKQLFANDSRAVAETFYKLGMAYSTNSQIDEAIGSFDSSLWYLRNRVKTLETIKAISQEHKNEVEEINALIPDIEDKIADMRMYKDEALKKVAEAFSCSERTTTKAPQDGASTSKQVTNISHLVKRKRKLDDEDKPNEEVPSKKPAT